MTPQPRPKLFPAPEFPPRRPALCAQMPPAVFPVLLGLLGLGIALRKGLAVLALPGDVANLLLGAAGGLWVLAAVAYALKLARRPGVLAEDMRVLPGRGGVAALSQGGMAMATAMAPFAPRLAGIVLIAALLIHVGQAALLVVVLRGMPEPARRVNPTLHLTFVGPIVGGVAAGTLGWIGLATALFWATLPMAVLIWVLSARQFSRETPPAPLRPMLAIHLAPASLLATVAMQTGQTGLAVAFGLLASAYFVVLLIGARWIAGQGFTPMWSSMTFPISAFAGALFTLEWVWAGVIVLIAALGLVPAIAYQVLKMWATGSLAQKTNAAIA